MSIEEQLIQDFLTLPDEKKREVIDFVEFLKSKNTKRVDSLMDEIINENRQALEELSR